MSFQFPEQPILLYPSLIDQVGVEAALLLTLYQQQFDRLHSLDSSTTPELILSNNQWLALGRYWSEDTLAQLTSKLVEHGIIDARFAHDGRVSIRFASEPAQSDDFGDAPIEEDIEVVSRLPVMEEIPPVPPVESYQELQTGLDTPYYPDNDSMPQHSSENPSQLHPSQPQPPQKNQPINPGPAPTFGGSIGWARKAQAMRNGEPDELQAKFVQQEQLKKQLHPMELGWQPSQNFYALLPRHNISVQFAQGCLDEFVLYWLDKDRKETNWDQKFLGWVKREWVKKQTQDGRNQRLSSEHKTGFSHENPRRDTRENRKRVTAAVMDIKDTDW